MKSTEKDDEFRKALVAKFCVYRGKSQDATESRHHRRCANWISGAYADAIAMYDRFQQRQKEAR